MSLKDDILIEHFLRNRLSKEEESQFLKRIELDEHFKEQFVIEKQLFETLNEEEWSFMGNVNTTEIEEYEKLFKSEETLELKKKLKEVSSNYKKNTRRKRIITFISSAAAIVFFVIGLNIFFTSTVDSKELYANNIELEKLPSFKNRGENNAEIHLITAEELFKEKKYKKSISVFDEFLMKNKSNSSVYIYKAIAHIELNQYKKGKNILDELIHSDLIDAEKGYWYKGLLFVKFNELENAKKTLNIIVEKSYFKNKEAKSLLEKL